MPVVHPATTTAPVATDAFVMQPLGLVISGNPTYEQWDVYGRRLFNIINASAWALGDWLNYGEGRSDWGEMWLQAAQTTQKSEDSMMSAMNVCKKFPVDRRRQDLSFGHHREVAALPELDQNRFLDLAEQHQWSVRELREAIKAERLLAAPPVATTDDGNDVLGAEDEIAWPQHVSAQLSIFVRPSDGHLAVMSHLVFDGNVPRLPRVWQQLERTAVSRRSELEAMGYEFVSSHDSWRAPSRRVMAVEFDTSSATATNIEPAEA